MRWLFVDIRQKPGKRPERITLGFPLPLRLLRWVLDTFGHHVPGLQARQQVWDTLEFLERGLSADTPLMVHVDDEDGEQVRVYLG